MMSGGKLCRQTRYGTSQFPGLVGVQLDLERGGRDSEERGEKKKDAKNLLVIFKFQFLFPRPFFWRWWAIYQVILFKPERCLNQV